ncbi:MAG: zinc-finger domain-containing protein [Candidatus Puniceispirillaceae bacterium]
MAADMAGAMDMAGSAASGGRQGGETIAVAGPRVACDGGGGPLGHPRVWLTLGTDGEITCPYCSRRYVKASGTDDD